MNEKPAINLQNDDFGAILNCAVRYCLGRQTYMPGLVVSYITPLLPYLSDKALWCFDKDITDAKFYGGYGDHVIDEPVWMEFHQRVREERTKRGDRLYMSWKEDDW